MNTIKKTLILLVSVLALSCNKKVLKYDFSKAKSHTEIIALLEKIQLDNKDITINKNNLLNELEVKGMHYAGVPIKKALISDHYTLLTTDTVNYSGKKLLEALEAENGITQLKTSYKSDINFVWDKETKALDYSLELVNGKHLALLGDKDKGELTITYKSTYAIPLANIHKKIKKFEKQPNYKLKIEQGNGLGYCNCELTIIVNDIIITEENSRNKEFSLNDYITTNTTSIKIIVKPVINSDSERPKVFGRADMLSVSIYDTSTDKIVLKAIEKASLIDKTSAEFKFEFQSYLPWYPDAWVNGVDLRNDKDLKQKIKAFYTKLGNAFLKKDKQLINDMFYQQHYEMQQLEYDTYYGTAKEQWEIFLKIQNKSYKYTIANAFDIEYNGNGKLIYVHPKDKSDMLIFTGKEYSNYMNYFLYQPKGSNELKIIR